MSFGSVPATPREWSGPDEGGGISGAPRINPAVVQFVMLIAIPFCLSSEDGIRLLIALVMTGSLVGMMNFVPVSGILATFGYIVLMSGIRRWFFPLFGYSSSDPFLMVGPIVVGLNFSNLLIGRSIPRDTSISKLVLALLVVMSLEVFNPLQGGLMVGLAGALFYIVPILWFYVGRLFASEANYLRLVGFAIIAITLVAAYGQYQLAAGFLPSELQYMRFTGFEEQITSKVSRIYSTLSSPADYAIVAAIGAAFCFAFLLRGRRIYIFLMVALSAASFFTAVRGAIVTLLFTCCCLWAIQGKTIRAWLPRLFWSLVVGIGGAFWSLRSAQTSVGKAPTGTASALIGHQADGLLNPAQSTASGHVSAQLLGIVTGIVHPFGFGLGATTLAAARYSTGSAGGLSYEGDFGNMFASLGIVGGIIFLLLVYHTMRAAILNWQRARSLSALCALACLLVCIGSWLSGGNYAAIVLVWTSVGYIDHKVAEWQARERAEAAAAKAEKVAQRASLRRPRRLLTAAGGDLQPANGQGR